MFSQIRMPNGRSSSVYSRGSPSEMTKLSTWTYTRYTPRLSGGIYDPRRTSFELRLSSNVDVWLVVARSADAQRTPGRRPTLMARPVLNSRKSRFSTSVDGHQGFF